MNFQPDPAKVIAVVVGVEEYRIGGNWSFPGPAAHAAEFAKWLRWKDVPAKNIKLFLSALPRTADEVARTLASCDLSIDAAAKATEAEIWPWLNSELPRQEGDHLVFFWSGHGALHDDERRLFCSDAEPGSLANLNFAEFAKTLRRPRHARFVNQLLVINTCANLFSEMSEDDLPNHEFGGKGDPKGASQLAFFAAAHGQVARSGGTKASTAFFETLMTSLYPADRQKTPQWPDFRGSFRNVSKQLENDPKNYQQPIFWDIRGSDGSVERSDASIPAGSVRVATLLRALRTGANAAQLQIHFHRTCRNAPRRPRRPTIEAMVAFLDSLPARADGSYPHHEFAVRVANELQLPDLQQWLDRERAVNASTFHEIDSRLKEETITRQAVTDRLVVRLDAAAGPLLWKHLRPFEKYAASADLAPHPVPAPLDARSLALAIRERAIAIRPDMEDEGLLAIDLSLPEDMLVWEIESVALPDLALQNVSELLGCSHPITLRWSKRASLNPGMKRAWQTLARQFEARLDNALQIEWADRKSLSVKTIDEALDRMREAGGSTVMGVGLGIAPQARGEKDPLLVCLCKGVPFAIWSHGANNPAPSVRKSIEAFFLQWRAAELLPRLIDLRNGTVRLGKSPPAIKVLWDPPAIEQTLGQPQTK